MLLCFSSRKFLTLFTLVSSANCMYVFPEFIDVGKMGAVPAYLNCNLRDSFESRIL